MSFISYYYVSTSSKTIIRIKANLTTVTPKPIQSDWHIDHDFQGTTAIFYLNTNNGHTVFKDYDQKVQSVANRVLIFPTDLYHAGVSSTNTKARYLINLNYLDI